MDVWVILLNLVYGTLFFSGFIVFIATLIAFCMAAWDKIGRDWYHRLRGF